MVITDLDGTLLTSSQTVSERDLAHLKLLGEKGTVRVIATGRSPWSFSKVIPPDFPIDFLIFSSGSGIMNWKTGEILSSHCIDSDKLQELAGIFRKENISFKVLLPAPDNHRYLYFSNGRHHKDFEKRMEFYRGFEQTICFDPPNFGEASQLLIILTSDVDEFDRLSALCEGVKIIRATSPLDHSSIWMEIFHPDVSKGNATIALCRLLGIPTENTLSVGNDYNDLDMLKVTAQSFVVANAPKDIRSCYPTVSSNNDSGFSQALERGFMLV